MDFDEFRMHAGEIVFLDGFLFQGCHNGPLLGGLTLGGAELPALRFSYFKMSGLAVEVPQRLKPIT
ncbi:MAG: hypothetical protein WBM24_17480, partial [Candidatus Sulfotelmatobacter sp.]